MSIDRWPGDHHRIAPGTLVRPRKFVPRFHWELMACGMSGHRIVGVDAKTVRPEDDAVVREIGTTRWHRCLRCDSWVALPLPQKSTSEYPPSRDQMELPLRGRPLRDLVVLRLIAIDRFLHFLGLGLISALILIFRANRDRFHDRVLKAITDLTGTSERASGATHGLRHEVDRLFSLSSNQLTLFAVIAGIYALIEGVEAIGLWRARRWAEYLTLLVTASLLPLEIYELATNATVFKAAAFVVNVAIVVYLLYAKRLFGLRGGVAAEHASRERDMGWPAIDAASPPSHVG
jgi:uncharacterized membrane protein (DUF2068 family)